MRHPKAWESATFRLASLYLLMFVASVGILAGLLFYRVHTALESEIRTQIANEVELLLFEYREDGLGELMEETEERLEKSRSGQRLSYMVQSPDGRVVFDRIAAATPPYGWHHFDSDPPMLFHFTALDNGYVFGVGKDLTSVDAVDAAMLRTFLWALGAVLLIGGAGGYALGRRTLAQLDAITRAAQAIGAGRLTQRIPLRHTGDELDRLGETLNHMFDRIERLVANVRQVSTGIAHDLRTPLARLRNRLEALREQTSTASHEAGIALAVDEVDEILGTFAALLRLAEVEAGSLRAGFRHVDLSHLVHQVADAYAVAAEDARCRLLVDVEDLISLSGDGSLLRQALANLVENALQHGGADLTVRIRLHRTADDIVLAVEDNGPGVPAAERERILKPFERMDSSRSAGGSGLGLALVAAIARLHDGRLQLGDNHPGLRCEIAFRGPNPGQGGEAPAAAA
jgi:signal transduction histidine kinase